MDTLINTVALDKFLAIEKSRVAKERAIEDAARKARAEKFSSQWNSAKAFNKRDTTSDAVSLVKRLGLPDMGGLHMITCRQDTVCVANIKAMLPRIDKWTHIPESSREECKKAANNIAAVCQSRAMSVRGGRLYWWKGQISDSNAQGLLDNLIVFARESKSTKNTTRLADCVIQSVTYTTRPLVAI
jgi:hypothetical protein